MKPPLLILSFLATFILGCLCQRFIFSPPAKQTMTLEWAKPSAEEQAKQDSLNAEEVARQEKELAELKAENDKLDQKVQSSGKFR